MKKNNQTIVFILLLLISAAFTFLPVDHYIVSDGYKMNFKSKDPSGSFSKMGGDIYFNDSDLANSKFDLSIDVSSISTGNGMQNKKAQTAEWFNATAFPKIKFVSTKVVKNGNDYSITGNLTIKGTTKVVTIPTKKTTSGNRVIFEGTFGVDRLLFQVGKKGAGVSDVMNVTYYIPATKN